MLLFETAFSHTARDTGDGDTQGGACVSVPECGRGLSMRPSVVRNPGSPHCHLPTSSQPPPQEPFLGRGPQLQSSLETTMVIAKDLERLGKTWKERTGLF